MNDKHTFAVCAYKESEYLEKCIRSLMKQSVKSKVIVCTSTPCEFIDNIAKKYKLPVYVREGKSDIRDDWNFAYNTADTDYVTIAHQDDVYNQEYVENMLRKSEKYNGDFLMFYTGYRPIKGDQITSDINCKLRAVLRKPMQVPLFARTRFMKRASLSLGNSICCPAVTYNKAKLGKNVFTSELKFNIDWDTFLKLADMNGRFLYVPKSLTYYRVHDGATSKEFIENNNRITEDTIMFNKFWPGWVTKIIMKFYKKAYDTYS